ncbi:carbohydrate esterase family 4 protein [Heliocybe sulcata]|uniref:chitin deacetylase n=1 Tax=Heliocybe sulcata TaxID=5364 RepID=A0A5C3MXP9_9AGAM|nr:carbohydrate esterase family 4 protein [Heliocybe sulcata]
MAFKTLVAASVTLAAFSNAQSWQDKASSVDPTAECQVYSYAPVQAMIHNYPTIWTIANLQTADTDAVALFNTLNSTIPQIAPKGTPTGDFSNVTPTYPAADPDCWWSYHQCTTPKISGIANDVTRCPTPNTWGLTVDDGPNCSHNAYYDYLQQQNQKATLFYIGSNVLDWPLEAQRGLADGHEICAHTWSHRYMTALTNEEAFAELYFSKKAIKDVLGITPQCWRPPFGDVDDRIRYIAQSLGMQTVIWVEDTFDYEYPTLPQTTVDQNYQNIINKAKNGTYDTEGILVLSHELQNFTMSENMKWFPMIQQAFKWITPLAVCNNNTKPYVEQDYTYPNFEQWMSGVRNGTLLAPTASPNAPISLPFSSGQAGSVSTSIPYGSPTATAGVTGTNAAAPSGSSAAASLTAIPTSLAAVLVTTLLGLVSGAVLVL